MDFPDYVKTMRPFFAKSIGNEELCGILFDSIIDPLQLKDKNGGLLFYDKTYISHIMNRKRGVPVNIRDNIFEPKVTSSIVSYFQKNIISALAPNKDDLCYRYAKLIEADESLSPSHKGRLLMLANEASMAAFLAELFVAAICQSDIRATSLKTGDSKNETNNQKSETYRPKLLLRSLADKTIVNEAVISHFSIDNGSCVRNIKRLVSRISEIHISVSDSKSRHLNSIERYPVTAFSLKRSEPVTIPQNEQDAIRMVMKFLKIDLPVDFFNMGGLRKVYDLI